MSKAEPTTVKNRPCVPQHRLYKLKINQNVLPTPHVKYVYAIGLETGDNGQSIYRMIERLNSVYRVTFPNHRIRDISW